MTFEDRFVLPHNIMDDFINQFVNYKKIEETDKKTGEVKHYYKLVGTACDFRLAFMHCLICLDIQLSDIGCTLRDVIDNRDFIEYNPEQFVDESNNLGSGVPTDPEEIMDDEEEEHEDYGIDNFKGGW